jgi:hypothetical protein
MTAAFHAMLLITIVPINNTPLMQLKSFFFIAFCLLTATLFSQEQLGLRLSNYAGINSTVLNPAYHSTTPFNWDVNIVEGALHFTNNYAYLSQTNIPHLWRNRENLNVILVSGLTPEKPAPPNTAIVDFNTDNRSRYLYSLTSVMGPSFYLRLGQNHTIGLITRARTVSSARGIDNDFSYYQYNPRPFFQDMSIDPFRMATAAWAELGFNYSYSTPTANGQFAIGATLKGLRPYEGAYFNNEALFQLQKLPGDSLAGTAIDFSYAHTTTALDELENYEPQGNGNGFALDLGITYTIEGYSDAIYDWKFGASITDVGWLNFNSNATAYEVRVDDPLSIGTTVYQNIQGLEGAEDYIEYFSFQTLGDPLAARTDDQFRLGLPTAFSLQASKSIGQYTYVDAVFVQGIPISNATLQRSSLLTLNPRFEHRWFEAALPVVVANWQKPTVGLSLRLAFLTIGTDHLGSFVGNNDLYGSDFYLALKLNPFSIGNAETGRGRIRQGQRKKSKVKCYYNF